MWLSLHKKKSQEITKLWFHHFKDIETDLIAVHAL